MSIDQNTPIQTPVSFPFYRKVCLELILDLDKLPLTPKVFCLLEEAALFQKKFEGLKPDPPDILPHELEKKSSDRRVLIANLLEFNRRARNHIIDHRMNQEYIRNTAQP